MSKNVRRSDDDLKRYYAYRCKVWKAQNPKTDWKVLDAKLGLDPAAAVAFRKGRNGSFEKVSNFARALGPDSEDAFKQLARAWAEKYPTWQERDPLPERIEFTGDALVDGAEGDPAVFSDDLRAAARALPGLMPCTPTEARGAAEAAWKASPDPNRKWDIWLPMLKFEVERLRQQSGERPSARHRVGPPHSS